MSSLFLIRHAQASFFAENYDQLSSLGETQARILGKHLVAKGVTFDKVHIGPAKRHQQTADLVGEAYQQAGLDWPEPQIVDGLNEHKADQLLRAALDELSEHHPDIRQLAENYRKSTEPADVQKNFQKLFERIVIMWTKAEIASDEIEPWLDFQTRVNQGLRNILEEAEQGAQLAAFSSVGPMSVVLQTALNMEVEPALHLGWRLRNCSVTEFIFSRNRFTLDLFNSVAHLEDDDLVTYR